MTLYVANAEGGINGANVQSGDPGIVYVPFVTPATTYSNIVTKSGSLAYRIAVDTTNNYSILYTGGQSGSNTAAAARAYIYLTARPTSSTQDMLTLANGIKIQMSTYGPMFMVEQFTGGNSTFTITNNPPLNTWIRIEASVTYTASFSNSYTAKVDWYVGDSTTSSGSASTSGTTYTNVSPSFQFGVNTSVASGGTFPPFYVDDLAINTGSATYIGPSVAATTKVVQTLSSAFAVTTPITASLTSTFGVAARVSTTQSSTFGISTTISRGQSASWQVLHPVSASLSGGWLVALGLEASLASDYGVFSVTTSDQVSDWGINSTVSVTLPSTYSIRLGTGQTQQFTYTISGTVSASLNSRYTVHEVVSTVNTALTSTYAIHQRVAAVQSAQWAVLVGLSVSHAAKWDVLSTLGVVSNPFQWNIYISAGEARLVVEWTTQTNAEFRMESSWSVRAHVYHWKMFNWYTDGPVRVYPTTGTINSARGTAFVGKSSAASTVARNNAVITIPYTRVIGE